MEILNKICFKCKILLPIDNFSKNKLKSDGHDTYCKFCNKEYLLKYKNNDKKFITSIICIKCSIDKSLDNFHKKCNSSTGYNHTCKSCKYLQNKQYIIDNREIVTEKMKKYRHKNKETLNKKHQIYKKERKLKDPLFKLSTNIKSLIKMTFTNSFGGSSKKAKLTEEILDCSMEFFLKHIEKQFLYWMNWKNFGNIKNCKNYNCSWDLDHIIPISFAKTKEDLYTLNHWSNFQPLCSKINRNEKKNKIYPITNLELKITFLNEKTTRRI